MIYAYITFFDYSSEKSFYSQYYKLTNDNGYKWQVWYGNLPQYIYKIIVWVRIDVFYKHVEEPYVIFNPKHLTCPLIDTAIEGGENANN